MKRLTFLLNGPWILAVCGFFITACDLDSSSSDRTEEEQADLERALNEFNPNPDPSTDTSESETPVEEENAAGNASEAFFREVRWLRTDPAAPNARVTKNLGSLTVAPDGVSFVASDLGDWPAQGDAHGVMCLAVVRDGVWSGGKFDHVRRDTRFRNFNNVGGYLPVNPRSGEPVRFWIVNYPGTEATNFFETTWP